MTCEVAAQAIPTHPTPSIKDLPGPVLGLSHDEVWHSANTKKPSPPSRARTAFLGSLPLCLVPSQLVCSQSGPWIYKMCLYVCNECVCVCVCVCVWLQSPCLLWCNRPVLIKAPPALRWVNTWRLELMPVTPLPLPQPNSVGLPPLLSWTCFAPPPPPPPKHLHLWLGLQCTPTSINFNRCTALTSPLLSACMCTRLKNCYRSKKGLIHSSRPPSSLGKRGWEEGKKNLPNESERNDGMGREWYCGSFSPASSHTQNKHSVLMKRPKMAVSGHSIPLQCGAPLTHPIKSCFILMW